MDEQLLHELRHLREDVQEIVNLLRAQGQPQVITKTDLQQMEARIIAEIQKEEGNWITAALNPLLARSMATYNRLKALDAQTENTK